MEKKKAKSGKKNRKFGKNVSYCTTYKSLGFELKNKRRRMARHIRHNPENLSAIKDFDRLFGNGAARSVLENLPAGLERRALKRAQRRRLADQRKNHRVA